MLKTKMNNTRSSANTLVTAIALVCTLTTATWGENVLRVGRGEGAPGDTSVDVVITATTDQVLHGYSLALSFPADVLVLQEISTVGTHVSGLNPEFEAPKTNNQLGIATLAVIIDFNDPVVPTELSATASGEDEIGSPHIVARLRFDVRPDAPGGDHTLRLVDGIGSPAAYNRFTNAGSSIQPRLVDGLFLVEGGNVLMLDNAIAFAGAAPNLRFFARALHPDPLDGFQISVAFDCAPNVISFNNSDITGTSTILPDPEFISSQLSDDFPCRVETGIVFDFQPPVNAEKVLPPAVNTPQILAWYDFAVGAAADDEKQWQDLTLENLENPVAPNNLFFVGAQSIEPRRVHGKIFFSQGGLRGRVVDAMSSTPINGSIVTLEPNPCATDPACNSSSATILGGWFSFNAIMPGVYTVKIEKPGFYTQVHRDILVEGHNETSEVGDLVVYEIPPDNRPPPDPVDNPFERGNANQDTRTDISDAIFLLNYLFRGNAAPECRDAADANDDGKNDISDPVRILNFFFRGEETIPPPLECGDDPTPDSLDCSVSVHCPE